MAILRKKINPERNREGPQRASVSYGINLILLSFAVFLLSFYIYQTISISSGKVSLVNYKKEFLERKNNLSASILSLKNRDDFEPDFIKENFKMAEIEKFDYIIVGPSEFALIEETKAESNQ